MEYKIAGYTVHFPHQAYGVQLGFMDKVLKTLNAQQNALLEAPTGSGKTLSLLCSALAWQDRLKQEGPSPAWDKMGQVGATEPPQHASDRKSSPAGSTTPLSDTTPRARNGSAEQEQTQRQRAEKFRELGLSDGEGDAFPGEIELQGPKQRRKVPKIYYATRTHSQIAQVVRELKRTTYRPKMAILASREHYCVNKTVMKKPNRDEECEKLMREQEDSCKYFRNVNKLIPMHTSHALLAHDIEDLCKVGKSHQACPYYAARQFAGEAELVFCPYSYLLDPVIRKAMDVDIDNAVLIFDEAHNIEDNARDAASAEIELGLLEEAVLACNRVELMGGRPDLYPVLGERIKRVVNWVKDRANSAHLKPEGRDRFEGIWAGGQMMAELEEAGLGEEGIESLHCKISVNMQIMAELEEAGLGEEGIESLHCKISVNMQMMAELEEAGLGEEGIESLQELYRDVRAEEEKDTGQQPPGGAESGPPRPSQVPAALKLGGLATGVISRLLTTLQLMHDAGAQHVPDYRVAMQRWMRHGPSVVHGRRGSYRARNEEEGDQVSGWVVQLCFWCLNPAVAFWEVNQKARSVVLTSGTLAPLDSFASELGADFPVRLEAAHVVNMRRQVLATVVPTGPGGDLLQATYKVTSTPTFQDSIGQTLLQMCQVVPDGVLVFLPSYILLERLVTRWQASGLWAKLIALKPVVSEPRGTGEAFDRVMEDFYTGVKEGRGGVFLAVCRGKVSEGLDFADANARAVMVVGIPYPNVKDTKVGLKKRYNDEGQRTRGLLSGDHWYSQQAFRALNQAIGRCLRHRNDYGAILLVDERFRQPRNQQHLSRWVKGALTIQASFEDGMHALCGFFERLKADPPGDLPPGPVPAAAQAADTAAAGHTGGEDNSIAMKGGTKDADKAGKAEASSQFVSASQPTLKALWRNPQGTILQHAARPGRKKPDAETGTRPLPPAWKDAATAAAMGWVKVPSPDMPAVRPGEVAMTQYQGQGAAGVIGDFATTQVYQPVMSTPGNHERNQQPHPASLAANQPACLHLQQQQPTARRLDKEPTMLDTKPNLATLATQAAAQPAATQVALHPVGNGHPAAGQATAQESRKVQTGPRPHPAAGQAIAHEPHPGQIRPHNAVSQAVSIQGHPAGISHPAGQAIAHEPRPGQTRAHHAANQAVPVQGQLAPAHADGVFATVQPAATHAAPGVFAHGQYTATLAGSWGGSGGTDEMRGGQLYQPPGPPSTSAWTAQWVGHGRQPPGAQSGFSGQPGIQRGVHGPPGAQGGASGQLGTERGAHGQPGLQRAANGKPGMQGGTNGQPSVQGGASGQPNALNSASSRGNAVNGMQNQERPLLRDPIPALKVKKQEVGAAGMVLETPTCTDRVTKELPGNCNGDELEITKQQLAQQYNKQVYPEPGHSKALPLSSSTVRRWLEVDLAVYMQFLDAQPDFTEAKQEMRKGAAYGAIWDCFELAREVAARDENMQTLLGDWNCSLPCGLQLVAKAQDGIEPTNPDVLLGDAAECLPLLREQPLLSAVEAMMWLYAQAMDTQPVSQQHPSSGGSHAASGQSSKQQTAICANDIHAAPRPSNTAQLAPKSAAEGASGRQPAQVAAHLNAAFVPEETGPPASTSGAQGAGAMQAIQMQPSNHKGVHQHGQDVAKPVQHAVTAPVEAPLHQRLPNNIPIAVNQTLLPQKRSSPSSPIPGDRHVKSCASHTVAAAAGKLPAQEQRDPDTASKGAVPRSDALQDQNNTPAAHAAMSRNGALAPSVAQNFPPQQVPVQDQGSGVGGEAAGTNGIAQIRQPMESGFGGKANGVRDGAQVRNLQGPRAGGTIRGARGNEEVGLQHRGKLLSKNAAEAQAKMLQAQKCRGAGAASLRDARAAALAAGWDSDSDMEDV